MNRKETFAAVYAKHLQFARAKNPAGYMWPESELTAVVARMTDAMARGSANKDSTAIKATLKELGIKNTYAAINAWFTGE